MTITLGALAAIIIITAILARRPHEPTEPTCGGHPLSFWLVQYDSFVTVADDFPLSQEFQQKAQAREAIRKIGTNALPFLLNRINYEPPTYYKTLMDKLNRLRAPLWLSSIANTLCGDPLGKVHGTTLAIRGFDALGTNAAAAIPDLAVMGTNYSRPLASTSATSALSYLGIRAVPTLLWARSNCPPWQLQHIKAQLVCSIAVHLDNTDAVPFLMRAVVDEDPNIRFVATNALQRIAPEMLTNIPAK